MRRKSGRKLYGAELWLAIDMRLEQLKKKRVRFHCEWVQAHSGQEGNVIADRDAVSFRKQRHRSLGTRK